MGLKSIKATMGCSFNEEKATASCPEDWELGALVREELPPDVSKKVSDHMKECGFCIDRAAVYYKALEHKEKAIDTPELWKEKAFQSLTGDSAVKEKEVSVFKQILAFIQKLTDPLPPLPGYAAAVLVILLVIIWNVMPRKEKIVTIASSERIITRDSEIPFMFGFMGAGEERAVNNMEIQMKGEGVVFKWKPVENALEYRFSLVEKTRGAVIFSQSALKKPQASIQGNIIEKRSLYAWIIEGKTPDGKYFEYRGEFVIVE